MVQTREDAQKFIETITREFKEKHTKTQTESDLIFINNVERENVKGYHGREILELLQLKQKFKYELWQLNLLDFYSIKVYIVLVKIIVNKL